jgi:hypothetical protein
MADGNDLATRAKARAESGGVDESWGERLELEEGETFVGRYRGSDVDEKNSRTVWLFWDGAGELYWSRSYAALDREMDAASPAIGDRVAIHRGPNYATQYDDEDGPKGRAFGVVCESSDEPRPAGSTAPATSGIPF